MITAKTIEIFLPDGDPKGIKVASITSRTVEVAYIPRAKLADAKKRINLSGVGVYVLVGISEEHSKPEVYIGETENCIVRLGQHNANVDFWNYALVITSRTSFFTKTHVKFLEWLIYDTAKRANRVRANNPTIPTKPYLRESMEADLYDNFETVAILIATLGLQLFQPAGESAVAGEKVLKFYLKGRGASAEGKYTEEGFLVYAGATVAKELTNSMVKMKPPKIRESLIADKILEASGEVYILKEDFLFSSPSTAADVVLGRITNGWNSWKLADGKTLHDIYRATLE